MTPSVGRIVHYKVSEVEAERANRRRVKNAWLKDDWAAGAQAHVGSKVHEGDVLAAMIVKVNDGDNVNLQVFLDGNDVLWVQDVQTGTDNGRWDWPPRV